MWLQWHCVSKPRDVVVLFYLARTYADASDQSLATCMIPEIILNIEYAHFDTELLVRTHVHTVWVAWTRRWTGLKRDETAEHGCTTNVMYSHCKFHARVRQAMMPIADSRCQRNVCLFVIDANVDCGPSDGRKVP